MASECVPVKACAVELATETGPQRLIQPWVVPFWKLICTPLVGGDDEEGEDEGKDEDEEEDDDAAGAAIGAEREADAAVFSASIAALAPMTVIRMTAAISAARRRR